MATSSGFFMGNRIMSAQPTTTTRSIVQYWQEGLWRSQLNHLFIKKSPDFHLIDKNSLIDETPLPIFARQDEIIWIAPIVGYREQDNTYWVPLWIPASFQAGKLSLTSKELPWLVPAQCDPLLGQSLLIEPIHCFDDWLRFEWLNAENTLAFENWSQALEACLALLDELSGDCWQVHLVCMGITLLDQLFILPSVNKLSSRIEEISPLLNAYAEIEDILPQNQFNLMQLYESAKLLQGQFPGQTPLSLDEFKTAAHTISLAQGELIAVKSSQSDAKLKVVTTVVASWLVNTILNQKPFPSLYLLAPLYCRGIWAFPTIKRIEDEVKVLQTDYQEYIKGLDLGIAHLTLQENESIALDEFEEIDSLDAQIEDLQQQDERYEQQFIALAKAYEKWQQKTKKSIWDTLFLRSKKLTQQEHQTLISLLGQEITPSTDVKKRFVERMREITVQRTKNHQVLVELVEQRGAQKGALTRWLTWLSEKTQKSIENQTVDNQLCIVQSIMGQSLFKLAFSLQEKVPLPMPVQSVYPGWGLYKFDADKGQWCACEQIETAAQWLIIDQANTLLPQQVAPFLAKAQRALFWGDNQDLIALPSMSAVPEEWALQKYALSDEEIVEQLHYKGMLLGTGNAFSVALINSTYHQWFDESLTSSAFSLNTQNEDQKLQYHGVMVEGQSEQKANMLINKPEAIAIVSWINEHLSSTNDTVIVTPFQAQKEILLHLLQAEKLTCEVFTFYELADKHWQNIIFSPVYTHQDKRPFLFDQGDHLFYSMVKRAIDHLWIIGDLKIFDPKTHSPSGHIAKKLFKEKQAISV